MATYTVKFESGQGRGSGSIVYAEGTTSLHFPFLPRSNRLFLPNAKLWRELLPIFARERREEILPRIEEYCRRFEWLKLSEARTIEELGCILLIGDGPFDIEYYGNPKNPLYSEINEAEERFEKSRPIV